MKLIFVLLPAYKKKESSWFTLSHYLLFPRQFSLPRVKTGSSHTVTGMGTYTDTASLFSPSYTTLSRCWVKKKFTKWTMDHKIKRKTKNLECNIDSEEVSCRKHVVLRVFCLDFCFSSAGEENRGALECLVWDRSVAFEFENIKKNIHLPITKEVRDTFFLIVWFAKTGFHCVAVEELAM